jgi:hypothetical protein
MVRVPSARVLFPAWERLHDFVSLRLSQLLEDVVVTPRRVLNSLHPETVGPSGPVVFAFQLRAVLASSQITVPAHLHLVFHHHPYRTLQSFVPPSALERIHRETVPVAAGPAFVHHFDEFA